jgi:chromosome segregation ATPase
MTDDLSDLPGPVRAELTRLRAERTVFVAERDDLLGRLQEADGQLKALIADRDRLAEAVSAAAEQELCDEQADALRRELATARQERDALRSELARTRAERDQLRLRLLDAEIATAGLGEQAPASVAAPGGNDRIAAAEARAAHLARELAATRATVSWRVTAPLRAVRGRGRSR